MAEESDPKKEVDGEHKAYDTLERDFQEVLQELATDAGLDKFKVEYEKVFRALKKSHENEKRLIKKCRELNTEIVAAAAKVQSALKLSDDDQVTITALKKEIENSWRMVDDSHEKEVKAKEQMAELKVEIANLSRLLEQGAAVGLVEEKDLHELIKHKEELTRERDAQVEQIVALRNEVMEFQEKLRVAEIEKSNLESEIQSLRDTMAQRKLEADKEMKRKELLEKQIRTLNTSLEARQQDIRDKQVAVQQSAEHVSKLQGVLKETQVANDKLQKEYNLLTDKVSKMQQTLEEHIHTNTQLFAENSQRQLEIKAREDEIRSLREEAGKASKTREQTMARLQQLEKQKSTVEIARDELKSQVTGLEREIQLAQRQIDMERNKQEELVRERERLNKARTTAENNTAKHADLVKVTEMMKKNLEQEIQGYRTELSKQEQVIRSLEREKDKFVLEANETAAKHEQAKELLALRDAAIVDLQKRIAEGETRLKQQQELYETVRAERNTHSRNLIELQDEIHELRRKLQMLNHQSDQLKQEISSKDSLLMKVKYDHIKAEKDCDALRSEINRISQQVGEQEDSLTGSRAEIQQLQNTIAEADQARLKLKKEYDVVVGERDVLNGQLVCQNEELRLLYEKIKIQQSTLERGQAQYRDRLNEIRVLRIKVSNLKRDLEKLRSTVANSDVLKREVHHLNRELLQERTKVKALSEELESPLNVHRWRKLEGSDPTTYEMILKIQMLQKRLIVKTEEVVEKDLLIQEKEKLYLELKDILSRQPGPEAAEQLSIYQASLREKTKQLKALASELNMYQAQVAEYKYEIERLNSEMNEVKRKYYEQKKAQAESSRLPPSKQDSSPSSTARPLSPLAKAASGAPSVCMSVQAF